MLIHMESLISLWDVTSHAGNMWVQILRTWFGGQVSWVLMWLCLTIRIACPWWWMCLMDLDVVVFDHLGCMSLVVDVLHGS